MLVNSLSLIKLLSILKILLKFLKKNKEDDSIGNDKNNNRRNIEANKNFTFKNSNYIREKNNISNIGTVIIYSYFFEKSKNNQRRNKTKTKLKYVIMTIRLLLKIIRITSKTQKQSCASQQLQRRKNRKQIH